MKTLIKINGKIDQKVISKTVEQLEGEVESLNDLAKLSTVFVEIAQNIMKYAKDPSGNITSKGSIEIVYDNGYKIKSKNTICKGDKEKIEAVFNEIKSLDEKALKKRYRELRRSGKNTHKDGGGIGFYEIAKLADVDYEFRGDEFHLTAALKRRKNA
jgi:hypothetical protein